MKRKLVNHWRMILVIAICAGAAIAAKTNSAATPKATEPNASQDVMSLDRRISALEQRLYSIESSINQLRQQQLMTERRTPLQTARDPEIDRLRSDITLLTVRVRELECGLVHLDERTLPLSVKGAQKRTGAQSNDPCRLNPESVVKLSARP